MTTLTWFIRIVIFILLVVFAVQNTEPVSLHFLLANVWQAPLVVVVLAAFTAGSIIGLLSVVGVIYRQRREISRLKKSAVKEIAPESREAPPVL